MKTSRPNQETRRVIFIRNYRRHRIIYQGQEFVQALRFLDGGVAENKQKIRYFCYPLHSCADAEFIFWI